MRIITLYRYIREDGGVTVSPNQPDCEYTTALRLIADEGMVLVNGDVRAACVDTDSAEEATVRQWTEEMDTDEQEDV